MSYANQIGDFYENIVHTKTYAPSRKYTYKWTLENVSQLKSDEKIVGPNFHLNPDGQWHAEIKKSENYTFWFYLHRHSREPEIKVKYEFVASDLNGKTMCSKSADINYTEAVTFHDLFPGYSLKNVDIINDVILFIVELTIISPLVTFNLETNPTEKDFSCQILNTLKKDFKKLYVNPKLADVTLRVENQETLPAHKVILSARSPVFARMFEQEGTVEHRDNVVVIDDIRMSTLKEFVAFLYSGELTDYNFETAIEVYYAADKYDVMELRQHCGHRVVSGLTKLNAGRALTLAEQHDDQALKDSVLKFIFHHYEQDKKNRKG